MIRALLFFGVSLNAQSLNRPILDAHNCYPYDGRWADRLSRALASGSPVSIEQDLAWSKGRIVLSHRAETNGSEPELQQYFFEAVRPLVEKALAESHRDRWPLIILHYDFKDNQPALLHAVWDVLGQYQSWLTTAVKTEGVAPLEIKPILVLTEDSDAQQQVFFEDLPAGARLRLFGSAHTQIDERKTREERAHLAATLAPEKLLTERPSNYRRWWNNSWFEVEEGGQTKAGEWTAAGEQRLRALVDHAHKLGYWIRFYTLDGFSPPEDQGWDEGYNFGSRDAVVKRWNAAIDAGVDFIATDQYEELGALIRERVRKSP